MNVSLERLKKFPLVAPIAEEPDALSAFAACLQEVRYEATTVIIRRGDIGREAHLLIEGTVEVVDTTPAGEPYTRAVLSAQDNLLFGELALIGENHRTASVIAKEACLCWILTTDAFHTFGESHPRWGWLLLQRITRVLAKRLDQANRDILTLFEALVNEIEAESFGLVQKQDLEGSI